MESRRKLSYKQTTTAIDSQSKRHQKTHFAGAKVIPLKGYKGHHADEFYDAIHYHQPLKSEYKPKKMKLRDLTPSQRSVHAGSDRIVRKKLSRPNANRKKPITVASLTNDDGVKRHFVQDGHHRLYPLAVRHGLDHEVTVQHIDLDEKN